MKDGKDYSCMSSLDGKQATVKYMGSSGPGPKMEAVPALGGMGKSADYKVDVAKDAVVVDGSKKAGE